jgi:hypothetical protein
MSSKERESTARAVAIFFRDKERGETGTRAIEEGRAIKARKAHLARGTVGKAGIRPARPRECHPG